MTIRDVAARAGVSIGTASKALNGQGKLRAETRDRVAAAARELGFAPNVLARGLLAGRTYTVGVISTDSFGRFSIPVMLGAEDALGAGQISVFMCDTRDDPDRERQYLDMLLSRQVDGLIVAGRRIEPRPSIGLGLGIPVVYAMTQSMDSDEPAILPDDTGGGRLAAEHRSSWAGAGSAISPARSGSCAARKRAAWLLRHGRPRPAPASPRTTCCTASGASDGAGRRSGWCWTANPDADAIFCGSDQIARGVTDALRLIGKRVPEDVAVVGYDNWSPMVLGSDPPLTSVDMCLEHLGRVAAEHLMLAINGEPTHGAHTVPCRLVSRDSTVMKVSAMATAGGRYRRERVLRGPKTYATRRIDDHALGPQELGPARAVPARCRPAPLPSPRMLGEQRLHPPRRGMSGRFRQLSARPAIPRLGQ